MRKRWIAALAGAVLLLSGCSSTGNALPEPAETLPPMTEAPEPVLMYYVTDHGTTAVSEVSQMTERLEHTGYTVEADSFSALPMNADAVICNAPREDLTREELDLLEQYMDGGGHLLLLMPSDASEVRYKNWERFLEKFCITMDYDRLLETDSSRMLDGDPAFPLIDQISAPDGMTIMPATAETPLYLHDARSFHFVVLENFSNIRQDVMLRAAESAVGEPCGGDFDDPVTLEEETLMTMLYSRDTTRKNAFVVCVGASDFLLDQNYMAESSSGAQDYVYAALDWAADPKGF